MSCIIPRTNKSLSSIQHTIDVATARTAQMILNHSSDHLRERGEPWCALCDINIDIMIEVLERVRAAPNLRCVNDQ
jgi:hypothetical protein